MSKSKTLFVVLGAGASYAASDDYLRGDPRFPRPPLTKDLFSLDFREILDRYPMAKNAAPEIQDAVSGAAEPALSLEDHLRERYATSNDELDQRRFLSSRSTCSTCSGS